MNTGILRQWHLLQMLPYHPRCLDPRHIKANLARLGIQVSQHRVQCDLKDLARIFPLAGGKVRSHGWLVLAA